MNLITILEAFILAIILSLDTFAAGFAYGSNKIKIPFISVQVINITCSLILGVSFLLGNVIKNYIPTWITIAICFSILFVVGVIKLLDGITKSIIRKYSNLSKEVRFSLFNFKFILNLYANPENADIDSSKIISLSEAIFLAASLSLDGLAVGFGAALSNINGIMLVIFSFITNSIAITLGCRIGSKITNLSWISGLILIIIAFAKLL